MTIFNKAIRDKIPEIIQKDGHTCNIQSLSDEKFILEIEKKLSIFGANLLVETLKKLSAEKIEFKKQDDSKVTYARKISKDETRINWNLEADKIIAHIHGLSPSPGAWFEHKGEHKTFV